MTVPSPQQVAARISASEIASARSTRSSVRRHRAAAGQQQPVPPQQPRLGDRQLSRRAARSMSGRASAGFVALMIALIMPSATVCDGVIETSVSPTASSPSRNSEIDSAPAMQPA